MLPQAAADDRPLGRLVPCAIRRTLWLGLVIGSLCGCGQRPSAGLTVEARRIHPPLLLSELQESPNPQELLDTSFRFVNASPHEERLQFAGAGCTCYKVTAAGRALVVGDELSVPGHGATVIEIVVPAPTGPGEREFTAQFAWLRDDGITVSIPLSLTIPVVADLIATPDVVSIGYRPGTAPPGVEFHVARHVRRPDPAADAPVFRQLPAELSAAAWRPSAPVEIHPGLWRHEWRSTLTPLVNATSRDEIQSGLVVAIGGEESPARSVHVSVLIQSSAGIRGPRAVAFGFIPPAIAHQRRILLTAADRLPFRITGAHCGDVRCRLVDSADAPAIRHWLTVEACLPDEQPLETEILIDTDHPDAPQLHLAVTARARQAALQAAAP